VGAIKTWAETHISEVAAARSAYDARGDHPVDPLVDAAA
jgi:hypothetical protein